MIKITQEQYDEYMNFKNKHAHYLEAMKVHNKRATTKFVKCHVCDVEMKYKSMFLHQKSKTHLDKCKKVEEALAPSF
jgi:hypothetical protein